MFYSVIKGTLFGFVKGVATVLYDILTVISAEELWNFKLVYKHC